jgi:PAS domain S-box-containing protein
MTGYSRDEVLGQPIHEHPVFDGDVDGSHAFWAYGHSEIREIPLRCKKGRSIELLASATARYGQDGRVDGVVCIGQDITERKNAERRLSEIIQRYQSLVDVSPDGVMVNCDNRVVFCNQAMARILGADSVDEVLGQSADHFNPPEDYQLILDRRERVRRGGSVGLRETVIVRLDGTRLATERIMAAINWEGENAFLVLTRDISQRKKAERQFRQVVESLHDGFVLYDADDRLVMWNDRWLENHKTTADMIRVGARFEDLLRANVARKLYPEAEGREEAFIEERLWHHRNPGAPLIRHLAGGRWIIIRGARTTDGGTFMINTDVTDIKDAENAAQQARLRAEAADSSKSEFLANMSHEFRTPLNAIIGFASVMESESFGPLGSAKYGNYAQYIKQSGQHLLSLINDILDLSKVEAGAVELHEERIDVAAAAEDAIRLVRDRARKDGLTLTLDMPAGLPALWADARKLNQILFNLLTNAIKFTKAGGQITLAVRCDPADGYRFAVADTGIGIAPENIPLVLSKFGQVDSSLTRRHEGSGLGLPLTKSLAELHGGDCNVESEVDVGTTVTIRFPAERIVRPEAAAADLPIA